MITGDMLCDRDQDICYRLQTMCDLPASLDPAGRITVTIGDETQGLTTPSELGEEIRELLKGRNELGPVIWHRSHRWTFLARRSARTAESAQYRRALRRTDSRVMPVGEVVALPSLYSNEEEAKIRKWVHPPFTTFRPDLKILLEALSECEMSVRRS